MRVASVVSSKEQRGAAFCQRGCSQLCKANCHQTDLPDVVRTLQCKEGYCLDGTVCHRLAEAGEKQQQGC